MERDNRRQERAQHPEIWKETIEGKKGLSTLRFVVMKKQVMEYKTLAASIKSFEERKDSKARTLSTGLIGASQTVHRSNDDQKKAHADYTPLSMQPQFNK